MNPSTSPAVKPPQAPQQPAQFLHTPDQQEALALLLEAVEQDLPLEQVRFSSLTFTGLSLHGLSLSGCRLERCRFLDCKLPHSSLVDTTIDRCDFSNADLSRSDLHRVQVENSKWLGVQLQESTLFDVALQQVHAGYANFAGGRWRRVQAVDCQMEQASFQSLSHQHVRFAACSLRRSEWLHTRMKGLDLRTCGLDGLAVSGAWELAGAIVTPLQACDLSHYLGLVVQEAP